MTAIDPKKQSAEKSWRPAGHPHMARMASTEPSARSEHRGKLGFREVRYTLKGETEYSKSLRDTNGNYLDTHRG
jgi:hypothetical protein